MPCGTLTRDDSVATAATAKQYLTGTGQWTVYWSGDLVTRPKYKSTTGECTPNFYKKKARGDLIPYTNFSQFEREGFIDGRYKVLTYSGGVLGSINQYSPVWTHGIRQVTESDVSTWVSSLELSYNDVVQAAVASAYSKFDFLTFLAEITKTVEMFRTAISHAIDLFRSFRGATSGYLEARYGWRVLYYEMQSLEDAIRELAHRQSDIVTGRVTASSIIHPNESTHLHNFGYGGYTQNVWEEYSIRVRGSAALKGHFDGFVFNPFLTAWELITYSFVVDWFVGIGQWIAALSALVLSSENTTAGGFLARCDRVVTSSDVWEDANHVCAELWCNSTSWCEYVVRTPHPTPLFPQIRVDLNFMKILDLVALLVQAFSNRR